jgi:hypothetical protein
MPSPDLPPILLVHQHQVQVVANTELVVHVLVAGGQIIRRQVQPAAIAEANMSSSVSAHMYAHRCSRTTAKVITGPGQMMM